MHETPTLSSTTSAEVRRNVRPTNFLLSKSCDCDEPSDKHLNVSTMREFISHT